jgi:HEAT repeat protein
MSNEIESILKDLNDSDPELRESALDRIGVARLGNAVELIVPFLRDPDAEVRGTAACNLGLIDDSRAMPYLIEVVRRDFSEKVRAEAIVSLAEYRSPEILGCLIAEVHREKRSRRPRQEVAKQLRNYDADEAVDTLIELLHDEDAFVRDNAAESLLQLNRPRLREVWESALKDRSPHVQQAAMRALANSSYQIDSKSVFGFG